jgi:hypothetical protein
MSDRIINYYEFPEREPDWVKLKQVYKRNVSRFNVPFFVADSEAEREFLRFCYAFNFVTHRKTLIEYSGQGSGADRFLYLCLKGDDGSCVSPDIRSFVDLSAACPGGGPVGLCGRGARQVDKVSVKPEGVERVTKLGFLTSWYPNMPTVFLTSAAVADALANAEATGCEIAPTDAPDCYQLRITAETSGPAHIGHAQMGKRCPVCGVAKMFIGSSERYFLHGDLKPVDFQTCRIYEADNIGQFEIINGFPIVSQRIFNLLLALKVKGLYRYTTDPPIKHAVVQVRDK